MTEEHNVKCRIVAAELELAKAKDSLKNITRGYKHTVTGRILNALKYYHPILDEEESGRLYITLKCEYRYKFRAAGNLTQIARDEGWVIGCCDAIEGTDNMQIRLFPISRT